jgi:hypothetical protein
VTKLLTKGFFEVVFLEKESTTRARAMATVQWEGLLMNFFKWRPLFQVGSKKAELSMAYAVKVQFPNLSFHFCNNQDLQSIISYIGEVLHVEAHESYIKRLVNSLVTMEVHDIKRLTESILIPSLNPNDPVGTMTSQPMYSGLPNQCKRCRRFGHFARTCGVFRTPIGVR